MTATRQPRYRVAIDIGGTFTDFVILDTLERVIHLGKTPTTRRNLWDGVSTGLREAEVPVSEVAQLAHGTTVGLNTLLERRGDPTGLITTYGFRDVYEIGRGARPDAYNLFFRKPVPLVPRVHRLEVRERLDAAGNVVTPLHEEDVVAAAEHFKAWGITSIAICFLHAYRNPQHELRAAEILAEVYPDALVSLSHAVAREWREYERTSTTVINAYVRRRTEDYIEQVASALAQRGHRSPFFVNQSSGGVVSALTATARPVTTLMSGPAGGVAAAAQVGALEGLKNIISFDMGGTSTDVCLIHEGQPRITNDAKINGHPVIVPMVAVHSIGAGGGSLAWVDEVGALNVGPRSAGAEPGPVCYGKGGTEPTVTDANLALGRMAPPEYLPGEMRLDADGARAAIQEKIGEPLGLNMLEAAAGITSIVNMKMAMAVRTITVERGLDPKDFALFAFGGAGPMHVCWIARELGIPRVVIPVAAGQFSALGILLSPVRHDFVRTSPAGPGVFDAEMLGQLFAEMEEEARKALDRDGVGPEQRELLYSVDVRYVGQEYTVNVPVPAGPITPEVVEGIAADFHVLHERSYSHSSPDEPFEFVNGRLTALGHLPKAELPVLPKGGEEPVAEANVGTAEVCFDVAEGPISCPVWDRSRLQAGNRIGGPSLVVERGSTTVIPPGCVATVSSYGNLLIDVKASEV